MVSGIFIPERMIGVTEERRILLLKIGYFPVTDDFWYGAGMPYAVEDKCDWALKTPFWYHAFMPFHEKYLEDRSGTELREIAAGLRRPSQLE